MQNPLESEYLEMLRTAVDGVIERIEIPAWLEPGSLVDVSLWDDTERPENRLGSPCTVLGSRNAVSGSGVVVDLENKSTGKRIDGLDSGWVKEWVEGE